MPAQALPLRTRRALSLWCARLVWQHCSCDLCVCVCARARVRTVCSFTTRSGMQEKRFFCMSCPYQMVIDVDVAVAHVNVDKKEVAAVIADNSKVGKAKANGESIRSSDQQEKSMNTVSSHWPSNGPTVLHRRWATMRQFRLAPNERALASKWPLSASTRGHVAWPSQATRPWPHKLVCLRLANCWPKTRPRLTKANTSMLARASKTSG
jgi:hypothetical protein